MRGDPAKQLQTDDWRLVARICGISERQLRDWRREPGFPANPDGTVTVARVVLWANADPLADPDDDLGNGDSVHLERFRAARASQEEIKLAQMQAQFFPLHEFTDLLNDQSRTLRRCGESFERKLCGKCGPRALQIQNDALDECDARTERFFDDRGSSDTDDSAADPPGDGEDLSLLPGSLSGAEAADCAAVRAAGAPHPGRPARRRTVSLAGAAVFATAVRRDRQRPLEPHRRHGSPSVR